MRFVICTTILPQVVEYALPGASPAAGKYIRNLEKALTNLGHDILEMSYIAIPGAKEAYDNLGLNSNRVVFKDKTIVKSIIHYQKMVLQNIHYDDVVMFYNVDYFDLGLVSKLNRIGARSVLILADYTSNLRENGSVLRTVIAKLIARSFKKFKYVITLSERAKQYFNAHARIEVMEGGIDFNEYKDYQVPINDGTTRYMYAGSLTEVTGVNILLEAIELNTDKNSEFYISGKGHLEAMVKEAAKADDRIKYIGFVPDEEYYRLLQRMNVFINPRNMAMEQNQNNFPSKVLEYLASGRMVISTKFPGWEKFSNCFEFCNNDAASLCNAMITTKEEMPELAERIFEHNREQARKYDWNIQAKKIIELIEG